MKLRKKEIYAIQAILDITNHPGSPVRIEDISDRQGIPYAFLYQIFRNLKKAKVVKSTRGPGGGYMLEKSLTTLADVVLALKDKQATVNNFKTEEEKLLHKILKNYENSCKSALKDVTLGELENV